MKTIVFLGIVLIVLGIGALVYQGFSYTTREKVAEVGPVAVTADTRKSVALPPMIGVLVLVGGIVLVAVGGTRKT